MRRLLICVLLLALTAQPAQADTNSNKQYAREFMLANYGWGDDQFLCLETLWQKESGWNYKARNKRSGAYGIPQALPASKMKSAGKDWRTNPQTQIRWGLSYIKKRYQSPCGALAHFNKRRWY